MKKYLSHIGLLILLGLLVFLYGFSSLRNEGKKVSEIEIQFNEGSNEFLTHEMVNKLLIQNQLTVKNQAKSVIDLQGLENNVLLNPYIETATVFLTVDGLLSTVVKQREPIFRVNNSSMSYYIDVHGIKVPLSTNFSARVPLVTGKIKEKDLVEVTNLINKINTDDFLKKEIIGIDKKSNDEYVFSVRSGNYKIEFGSLDDVTTKFKKIKAFYNKAFIDKTIHQYKTINVKYHNQVVCAK